MKSLAILTAVLAAFVYLVHLFSFWIAFGLVYLSGLLVVALIALAGRRPSPDWDEPSSENVIQRYQPEME